MKQLDLLKELEVSRKDLGSKANI